MTCKLQRNDGSTIDVWTRPDRATGYYLARWRHRWQDFACAAIKISNGFYTEIAGSVTVQPQQLTEGKIYAQQQRAKRRAAAVTNT